MSWGLEQSWVQRLGKVWEVLSGLSSACLALSSPTPLLPRARPARLRSPATAFAVLRLETPFLLRFTCAPTPCSPFLPLLGLRPSKAETHPVVPDFTPLPSTVGPREGLLGLLLSALSVDEPAVLFLLHFPPRGKPHPDHEAPPVGRESRVRLVDGRRERSCPHGQDLVCEKDEDPSVVDKGEAPSFPRGEAVLLVRNPSRGNHGGSLAGGARGVKCAK